MQIQSVIADLVSYCALAFKWTGNVCVWETVAICRCGIKVHEMQYCRTLLINLFSFSVSGPSEVPALYRHLLLLPGRKTSEEDEVSAVLIWYTMYICYSPRQQSRFMVGGSVWLYLCSISKILLWETVTLEGTSLTYKISPTLMSLQ